MSELIYKKMVDVMRDVGAVGKDQKNTAQGYKFRGIDQFVNALHPALVKNNVFLTTEVLERTEQLKEVERSNGKKGVDKHVALRVKYTFYAEDGSHVSSTLASEGLDSGDKATNKALSAALKYALIQTFSVPTEDMEEADRFSPEMGVELDKKSQPEGTPMKVDAPVKNALPEATASKVEATTAPANGTKRVTFKRPAKPAAPAPATEGTPNGWE